MSYMEILSLQKGFLEKSGINIDDYRNTFIRKTYTLLLLEYICIGGISLLSYYISYWGLYWLYWVLVVVCQLCHFYFEFSPQILTDQTTKKTFNYIFSTIYLISLSFSFFFFWGIVSYNISGQIWITYLQIGSVILLLNFYANMTGTHFQGHVCWIIVLVTPIGIEFLINFFLWGYPPLFQTFVTMIITWYCSFMLQITQEYKFVKDFNFDEIQVLCCKLLGLQYEIIVYLIKSILKSNNSQNDLIVANYEVKIKYFRQISFTFSACIMLLLLSEMYGCDRFYICTTKFLIHSTIDENSLITVTFAPSYWISLSFCLAMYPIIVIFHRRINYIIKWILVLIQIIFYEFVIIGFSNYLALNNTYENSVHKKYLLEMAFCMLSGLGIGLQSYSTIKKEDINYKQAFNLAILCPLLIFISQIIFVIYFIGALYLVYLLSMLLVFAVYLIIILYEIDWQLHKDKIDVNAKEYQFGAMLILQPIQTIIARIVTIFI